MLGAHWTGGCGLTAVPGRVSLSVPDELSALPPLQWDQPELCSPGWRSDPVTHTHTQTINNDKGFVSTLVTFVATSNTGLSAWTGFHMQTIRKQNN